MFYLKKGEIDLKKEYISYAKKISEIGDLISKGARKFGDGGRLEGSTIEVLNNKRNLYEEGLSWYKRGFEGMVNLNPPDNIIKEHRDLSKSIQDLIDSSNMMVNSVGINELSFDQHSNEKGRRLQSSAIEKADRAVNEIIAKFKL